MNQEDLNSKLSEIEGKAVSVVRTADNRIWFSCEAKNSYAVNKFLLEDVGCRFVTATGIDCDDCFEVIYHFLYDQAGCVINVKAFIRDREKPAIESITPLLLGAEWAEREIHDILGIEFLNHPNLKRLILADDWPEGVYPMRKEVK